jgi:putative endonuclease
MATHIDIGKAGEKLAEEWLIEKGFSIIARNWRYGKDEIDLIASFNEMLHFVEVKCRSSNYHGHPEEAVNKKKIKTLLRGIEQYLFIHPQYDDFRLDILSITQIAGKETEYFFIEDVTL